MILVLLQLCVFRIMAVVMHTWQKSPFSAQSLTGRHLLREGQGLRTRHGHAGHGGHWTWETAQCPPVREVDLPRGCLFSGNNTHTEPHLILPAQGTHSPGASALWIVALTVLNHGLAQVHRDAVSDNQVCLPVSSANGDTCIPSVTESGVNVLMSARMHSHQKGLPYPRITRFAGKHSKHDPETS